MNSFVTRQIEDKIATQKDKFPIIALTGPRQSGKTTLLKALFSNYRYVSLENPDMRTFATDDPVGFLAVYNEKVIFDEVQRVPELFSYIQEVVDESGQMGQFILSGSQNFHLLKSITQTLAGRVALFKLLPFDFAELKNAGISLTSYAETAVRGFYPALYTRKIDSTVFYANYIQTYIEKDVTELLNIRDIALFRTFLGLCAARAGQLLNISALANECDISQPTAKAWLSILSSSYITFQLQPYHQNFNKRLVKSPKLYFYDTGLLNQLLGIKTAKDLMQNRLKGNIFENMIVAEYQKQNQHQYLHHDYYFWQSSDGREIDMLLKTHSGFEIFEIKATQTIMPDLFKQLDYFDELTSDLTVQKNLVYGGEENQRRTKYNVISWKNI